MTTPRRIRRREAAIAPERLPAGLHPVLRRVLAARAVAGPEDLDLGLARLHPPSRLEGVDHAARILADAVMEGRRILVAGDFDADGATGTAVALRALNAMGAAQVEFRVPNRFEYGYGLSVPLVETLAASPPDVLVTVDSGISSLEGVRRARQLGCRVVVTDHHLPGERLPEADAVVNPNCPGDRFPSKALAGVGVVFYLVSVVRSVLREAGWFSGRRREPNLGNLLDLVALGTVADLVPLDRNNRILVRAGLERIRAGVAAPGLLALLRVAGRDYRHAEATDLGFGVAPRLNAAGRLEDMAVGIRCLVTDDHDEALELASTLDELNRQRRDVQEQMQAEALAKVDALLERVREAPLPHGLCLFDEGWHQGIVGLVASRVKDVVHRPVVAFAPETEGSPVLKGSARSVKGVHVRDALALVEARRPGLMAAFGGHAMAAGLTLGRDALEAFEATFDAAVETLLGGEELVAEVLTDGEIPARELGLELAQALAEAGPWGQKFPEPLFEGAFEVVDQRVVGGAHLKLSLRPLEGAEAIDAIAFRHLPEDLPAGHTVRALYRLDVNRWRGQVSCQLRIEAFVG